MGLGLLLAVLGLGMQTQAMIANEPQEFKQYEVVYPQKLHVMQKREIQENPKEPYGKEEKYEPEVQYQITLNGENVVFRLHRNNEFLSPGYTETYYSSDGKKRTMSPQDMENCYYQGHILHEKNSIASLSLCGGLRGFFKLHNQTYLIEPLKAGDEEAHAILKYEEMDSANQTCGVKHLGRKHIFTRNPRAISDPKYDKHKGDQTSIRNFLFEVVNFLNVIYNTLDVHVALVGMEIWSDTNKIKVESNVHINFDRFLNWHRSRKERKYDHIQLLSGIGFNHKRVGLTAANSICSPNSVAVIEAYRKNSVSLVGVMSHELGHALGMDDVHYSTQCPSGSCVMNQYLSSKFPKDFSQNSLQRFRNYLLTRKPLCLLQAPAPEDIITNPVCGNKLQEVGEDCDCGKLKECTNPCCDAQVCKWKPGTQCEGNTATRTELRPPLVLLFCLLFSF